MANEIASMSIYEKRNEVENALTTGDSYRAQDLVDSIIDKSNNKLFLNSLASRAEQDKLPGVLITYDKEGNVEQIKSPKLTIRDEHNGHIDVSANHWMDAIHSKLAHTSDQGKDYSAKKVEEVRNSTLAYCLRTSGTPQSCPDRAKAIQMKEYGAD